MTEKETKGEQAAFKFEVSEGDLFLHPDCDGFFHCISLCAAMGKGIAKPMKEKCGALQFRYTNGQKKLNMPNAWAWPRDQPLSVGSIIVQELDLPDLPRYVFHLVTKTLWRHKPTLSMFDQTVRNLANCISELNITTLHGPAVGCGQDLLKFEAVEPILKAHLSPRCNVHIFVLPSDNHIYTKPLSS